MKPKAQPTSPDEIRSLIGIVKRDLQQADLQGLHADGVFGFLYNAALQLATILVRLRGERFGSSGHHRNTLSRARELLPDELASAASALDLARRKRNASVYDQAGVVTQEDIAFLKEAIESLRPWILEQARCYLAEQEG